MHLSLIVLGVLGGLIFLGLIGWILQLLGVIQPIHSSPNLSVSEKPLPFPSADLAPTPQAVKATVVAHPIVAKRSTVKPIMEPKTSELDILPTARPSISGLSPSEKVSLKKLTSTQKLEGYGLPAHPLQSDDGLTRHGKKRFHAEKVLNLPPEALRVGEPTPAEIFVNDETRGGRKLLKREGEIWNQKDSDTLHKGGVALIQARCDSDEKLKKLATRNIDFILQSREVPLEEKASATYVTLQDGMVSAISSPSSRLAVQDAVSRIKHSITYLDQDKLALRQFFEVSSPQFTEVSHPIHVSSYSIAIAKRLGYTKRSDLLAIGIGATLHDIGKTKIDPRILTKPGKLTDEEFREVKKHVEYGHEIVLDNRNIVPELAAMIVRQHHERRTGNGYPQGTKEQIHLFSRIVGFVDFFDAMTLDRPYQTAMSSSDALKYILETSKSEFDRNLYVHLIHALGV
jgi:HD-GYP domain-containing protein (c-di-GMP phosphodiesterase class II)